MPEHMLKLIHQSHLVMVKSKQRAREVLYWPGMSADGHLKVKRLFDNTKYTQKFYYDSKRAGNPPVALKPGDQDAAILWQQQMVTWCRC